MSERLEPRSDGRMTGGEAPAIESPIDPGPPNGWPNDKSILWIEDDTIIGSGFPLRALVHAVVGPPWVWYSLTFGDYADNALAIAVREALPGAHVRHEIPLLGRAIDDPGAFDEYVLTPELREHLGIRFDVNAYSFDRRELALREFKIHDNWFFGIRPFDPAERRRLLYVLMRTHGYWMGGVSADWTEAVDLLDRQLARGLEVRLKSRRRQQRLDVTVVPRGHQWWQRKDQGAITVEDGRARIERAFVERLLTLRPPSG